MIDTVWVDTTHGLSLHEGPHSYRDNENGVLFYLQYILLKEAKGLDIAEDIAAFKQIVKDIAVPNHPGLFNRGSNERYSPDDGSVRVISHDNMTAIAAFDARYGDGSLAADIALVGMKNFLRYDNAFPDSPRWKTIQWPTDWAFWAWSSNKWYLKVLATEWYPLWLIRSALGFFGPKDDTSGRLLNFVRLAAYRDHSPWNYLSWKLFEATQQWKYGDNWLHEIMKIYFQNPNHPLHSLSDKVKFK